MPRWARPAGRVRCSPWLILTLMTCAQDALYAALGAASAPGGKVGPGTIVGITAAAALIAAAVGLAVHKLRMRHVMQSEIRSIMSQYMPLVRPRCLPALRTWVLRSWRASLL